MPRSIFLIALLCLTTFSNCTTSDEDQTIIGQWKLIQVLADPVDGSGVFRDFESNKTITFSNDGTFSSNQALCSSDSEEVSTFGRDFLIRRGTYLSG